MTKYKLNNVEVDATEIQELIKKHPELLEKKSKKPWRAEMGGRFYFIDSVGKIGYGIEYGHPADDHCYLTGNYYQTEAEAQKALERQKAIGRLTHKIIELNGDWEADLNSGQRKYCVFYDNLNKVFKISFECNFRYSFTLPHMSQQTAETILKEDQADLKLVFEIE